MPARASARERMTVDGNEAVASVAHRLSDVIAIYPITPSSPMGERSDEWSATGRTNVWGAVPTVVEMQSEAGVAGAVHGALQAGALATTFTSSQGLLLMIPNLYKIAGELTAFTLHVAARSLATHALSIFGDHSDVMACRQIGLGMLASGSVQEAHDLALVAHAATLRSRIPFLHFFDGFRTSHELAKIERLSDEDLRALVDDEAVAAHRQRALTPDAPVVRGAAQNPDTFFQAREAANSFYAACPGIVQDAMDALAARVGRSYRLFDYVGHPAAERVIVLMGSGTECVHEVVEAMVARGERVGVVKVHLYRPFSRSHLLDALPRSVRAIAVLDRAKEPGALGEPLYQDVVTALAESGLGTLPRVVGGRYGLSSKEFDPAMVRAVFTEIDREAPKNHFTVGIVDDVTWTSLDVDPDFDLEFPDRLEAVFYGLGADGTVSSNESSIRIVGDETENAVQGFFEYDSKKSGTMTTSHVRFGPGPIRSTYRVKKARFVACHQAQFLERIDVLERAASGATFLLNAPWPAEDVWRRLPREVQETIRTKGLEVWVVDADAVARETGLGRRIGTILQTCFFALSKLFPREEATLRIREAIVETYGHKGADMVDRNFAAVDAALDRLRRVEVPSGPDVASGRAPVVPVEAPDFVQRVTAMMLASKGDLLPVSAFPVDGTWPSGTARWEKRNIAHEIPVWDEGICIQCNKCVLVCPHAAIRAKAYPQDAISTKPATFKAVDFDMRGFEGTKYTLQVAPEDCTGCTVCVAVCPVEKDGHKALAMQPQRPLREAERENYDFFLALPSVERSRLKRDVKGSQLLQPLFEYPGACAGCGETPYLKLLTQLFGDRLLVANATGCSSIFGGNLPTTPWSFDAEGRGPAWSNSLFEDDAEFGLGFRLALDARADQARGLVRRLSGEIGDVLATGLLEARQGDETGIVEQRARVAALRERLARVDSPEAARLSVLADALVRKTVWIVGGDGWAYDIGFGGLDHVLSTRHDVNVLVLDTEVYSNTGGQQSKATPLGASAKFAVAGKSTGKKDLGLMAMSYRHVYVARVAFGAKDAQTVKTLLEAEAYEGPSLVIAYAHCIAHGYDLACGLEHQALAVKSALWPLYRFDPRRIAEGLPPLQLDSGPAKVPVEEAMRRERRFLPSEKISPARHVELLRRAQEEADERWALYEALARLTYPRRAAAP